MSRTVTKISFLLLSVVSVCCDDGSHADPINNDALPPEAYSGGTGTTFEVSRDALSRPMPILVRNEERQFFRGRAFFRDIWVTAPASPQTRDGLGPVYNAHSCESCHTRDGRGHPPASPDNMMEALVMRLSVPNPDNPADAPIAEPTYGGQLQNLGILGVAPEGDPRVSYIDIIEYYDDGTAYTLHQPVYDLSDLNYGPMQDDVMISPRAPRPMIGLGLLGNIDESVLQSRSDPDDANHDGISGRLNHVYDIETDSLHIGRYGWKASQPNLAQQNARAALEDIGLTSPLFTSQACPTEADDGACVTAPTGGDPELIPTILDDILFYTQTLAVPGRRDVNDPMVQKGQRLFRGIGCVNCHVETMVTGTSSPIAALNNQTIHPYSDLLLHDMGTRLADGRPDGEATGNEWRTPPLWGLGLVKIVSGRTSYLHDGRATSIAEAILWHGGEATQPRNTFAKLSAADRQALLTFLESL